MCKLVLFNIFLPFSANQMDPTWDAVLEGMFLPPAYIGAWKDLLEDFGFKHMPPFVLCKIVESKLNYKDGCFIAAHFFQNGISPEFMSEILLSVNRNANPRRIASMVELYRCWSDYDNRSRYYAYDLEQREIVDLNVNHRIYRLHGQFVRVYCVLRRFKFKMTFYFFGQIISSR